MKIEINGEQCEVPDALTLDSLLIRLGVPLDRVAVERNRQIVRRQKWCTTQVTEGDRLEVVQLVGGGRPAAEFEGRRIP
jgi:sulfur carrier protein